MNSPWMMRPKWLNDARRWMDKNLPVCPFCRKTPGWEAKLERSLINRYHFRCVNCLSVISIPVNVVTGFSFSKDKSFIVEYVGSNVTLQYLEGKKQPLSKLQESNFQPKPQSSTRSLMSQSEAERKLFQFTPNQTITTQKHGAFYGSKTQPLTVFNITFLQFF